MPIENITLTDRYERVASILDPKQFEIPRGQQDSKDDFPIYLEKQLNQYIAYYTDVLIRLIEDESGMPFGENKELNVSVLEKSLLENITTLTKGINQTIGCHYDGRLMQANQAFREALNHIGFNRLTSVSSIPAECDFYRTRSSSDRRLSREELFHNPFENRGRVATSRYSIPGLPALYLGDSIYVCWEEYRRKKMDDLYFSRFQNKKSVRVVKIQRIEDFLEDIEAPLGLPPTSD
jgi:hypothetical protein